jgi:hypothetical protein
MHGLLRWVLVALHLGIAGPAIGQSWVALTELRQGTRAEWRLEGLPETPNPLDPDRLAVDAEFVEPGGGARQVPAFWYRPYRRELRNGNEVVSATGPGEWRLRYYPFSSGAHAVTVRVRENGGVGRVVLTNRFEVAPATVRVRGFAQVAPDRQYFEARVPGGTTEPLALVGADVCWHGARGTYDYDDWFPSMAASGWTWARLWMWPVAFGIEAGAGDRLNYRMDRAWQLDRVFEVAEQHGLLLLLCLDYHGMFETEPDFWGGNNYWLKHPYHVANGGPCATQRSFFTNGVAQDLYRKRLRYLVARYGASPSLHAWQFFNEIDNVYRHLNAAEVASWHKTQGEWLKANDPWGHLVTTSLTSQSNRPEIWELTAMDFAVYHSYSEPAPARRLTEVIGSMRARYAKPVLVGEAGVDWRGWSRQSDPFLRGFRQLIWGGVMSGSAGTSMSWWWESIHSENAYPIYRALTNVLAGTGWSRGRWETLAFQEAGPAPSAVGPLVEGGTPFTVTLPLDGSWGGKPTGKVAIPVPAAGGDASRRLNSFVHGTAHPDLRVPFEIDAWFGEGARLVAHLNSVSDGAVITVRANGVERFRRALPNKDRGFLVNNEYNEDLVVELPAGRQRVEIRNAGADWFYLDWVRLEGVLPARYASDWQPTPASTGLRRGTELLVHVVAPGFEYPAGAMVTNPPPILGSEVVVQGVPPGDYASVWFRTTDGVEAGRGSARAGDDGRLVLKLPAYTDELAGHVFLGPRLRAEQTSSSDNLSVSVDGVRPGQFLLERADDIAGGWVPWDAGAGWNGTSTVVRVPRDLRGRGFFRVRWPE